MTIARFLANEFGLAGKTNLEKARADMIVDCVSDMLAGFVAILRAQEGQKDELTAKLVNEIIPNGRQVLEKLLGTDKFFAGNEVSSQNKGSLTCLMRQAHLFISNILCLTCFFM